MRKLLFLLVFLSVTFVTQAQNSKGDQSFLFQTGYQSNAERFLLGMQYRYVVANNIRVAPDVMYFFPKDKTNGLDINLNLHYVVDIDNGLSLYPLMGFAMQNNRFMGRTVHGERVQKARGYTDFGFNMGAGFGYNITGNLFLNSELKYMFGDNDCFVFSLGVGFHF